MPETISPTAPTTQISKPGPHDVACGRGNNVNHLEGNLYFRGLVKDREVEYAAAPKHQKRKIARAVVEHIQKLDPPGRFVKQDKETGLWFDIGDKKAYEKTRQALRENAPELLKEITPVEDGDGDISKDGVEESDMIEIFETLAQNSASTIKDNNNNNSSKKIHFDNSASIASLNPISPGDVGELSVNSADAQKMLEILDNSATSSSTMPLVVPLVMNNINTTNNGVEEAVEPAVWGFPAGMTPMPKGLSGRTIDSINYSNHHDDDDDDDEPSEESSPEDIMPLPSFHRPSAGNNTASSSPPGTIFENSPLPPLLPDTILVEDNPNERISVSLDALKKDENLTKKVFLQLAEDTLEDMSMSGVSFSMGDIKGNDSNVTMISNLSKGMESFSLTDFTKKPSERTLNTTDLEMLAGDSLSTNAT